MVVRNVVWQLSARTALGEVESSLIIDFRGGPVWHLENFAILGEAHSMYLNFFGKTRGGLVEIL